MYKERLTKDEKEYKVKRKYLKRAKNIPHSELDANDVQIVVVASILEELENGKPTGIRITKQRSR